MEPPAEPTVEPAAEPPVEPPVEPAIEPARPLVELPDPEATLPTTVEAMKQEAFDVAGQVLNDFPNRAKVTGLMGSVYHRYLNTSEAVKCWHRCLEQDPQCADAYGDLGTVALEQGDYEQAAALWRKAAELEPDRGGVHRRYGGALLELGKAEEALAAFQKEKTVSSDSGDTFVRLGQAYLQLKDYEKAAENYERAVEIDPDRSSAWYALATACTRLGRTDRAKQCQERFLSLQAAEDANVEKLRRTPGDATWAAGKLAQTHGDAARVYAADRDPRRAEWHWRRAAAVDSDNEPCRRELVLLYLQSGRLREAARLSRQLAEIAPDNALYQFRLGTTLARLSQFAAAEEALRRGIELAPQQAIGYRLLSQSLTAHRAKASEAKTAAEKLVDLEPTARNYAVLSEACQASGDRPGALAAARRASEMEPNNRQYQRMHDALQERN